jgi:hypothetical protein
MHFYIKFIQLFFRNLRHDKTNPRHDTKFLMTSTDYDHDHRPNFHFKTKNRDTSHFHTTHFSNHPPIDGDLQTTILILSSTSRRNEAVMKHQKKEPKNHGVNRSSILFKTCARALPILPSTDQVYAQRATDHLVVVIDWRFVCCFAFVVCEGMITRTTKWFCCLLLLLLNADFGLE